MKTAIYRRVSTDHQDNSMLAQEAMNEMYCTRLQLPPATSFSDDDVSGSIFMMDRPGGGGLLRWLEIACLGAGAVHLVTAKQDRLGRDTLDQITTIRRIWEMGVTPHFTSEGGAFPRTDQNELLFEIKASCAQYERNLIRSRTRTVLNHKAKQGQLIGTVPYGWDCVYTFADGFQHTSPVALNFLKDPVANALLATHGAIQSKLLVINEAEQQVIKDVRQWVAWGHKQEPIAHKLNEMGIPTKTGKTWSAGNVRSLLNVTTAEKMAAQAAVG